MMLQIMSVLSIETPATVISLNSKGTGCFSGIIYIVSLYLNLNSQ